MAIVEPLVPSRFISQGVDCSDRLAAKIAAAGLPHGCHVHMIGDLGVGKTTFIRGVLRALGYLGPVSSPSYALASTYVVSDRNVLHMDFFRCSGMHEWLDAGLEEELDSADLILIEWPEKTAALPVADLEIVITDPNKGNERILEFKSPSGRCSSMLHKIQP